MAETTKRPNGVRSYIADTLALLLFFTTTEINQRALHRRHDMGASLARTPPGRCPDARGRAAIRSPARLDDEPFKGKPLLPDSLG